MDRLKFLNDGGQRILLVDCSNLGPDELVEIFDEAEHLIHEALAWLVQPDREAAAS